VAREGQVKEKEGKEQGRRREKERLEERERTSD
jgi:hypothetical protein